MDWRWLNSIHDKDCSSHHQVQVHLTFSQREVLETDPLAQRIPFATNLFPLVCPHPFDNVRFPCMDMDPSISLGMESVSTSLLKMPINLELALGQIHLLYLEPGPVKGSVVPCLIQIQPLGLGHVDVKVMDGDVDIQGDRIK